MKKKILTIITVTLVILSLVLSVACGDKTPAPTPTPNPDDSTPSTPSTPERPTEDNYTLEKEEGKNQLTFYWFYNGDLSTCDMWIWYDGKDGSGNIMHAWPKGGKVIINVPQEITQVGFIVRRGCDDPGGSAWGNATKDFAEDRFVEMEGDTTIYLKSGDGNQYSSTDGGNTLIQIKKFYMAGMTAFDKVSYNVTPACKISSLDSIKLKDVNGREIEVTALNSLGKSSTGGVLTLAEKLDIGSQYTLWIDGYGEKVVQPTSVFDSKEFKDNFVYDGDDLGAVIDGKFTTFKVWAPTASKVKLNLFTAGDGEGAYKTVDMQKADKGVWTITEEVGHGTYYTYSVTTALGEQEAVDPYARTTGVNGDRGMIVDLSLTNPEGFENEDYLQTMDKYTEAVVWEVHVRDFSNKIASSQYPGKFMAFTESGLTNSSGIPVGVDYLVNLGITHVHLLPSYDYATVDEANPDSGFNWGYDPKNYNVPEGSYSTDPFHGEVRVNEFKQMVQSLHSRGLGVIMDVVYNHTYDINSCLNKVVPNYYYRYMASGAPSNGSGCGNETASERTMFRKYMIDSVSYWAKEYKVDGFRFDLMGLHDLDTMQDIEKAVHSINPKALIYGEGWTGGTSTLPTTEQTTTKNAHNIPVSEGAIGGVAVFNDVIRDGLKGSVFEKTGAGYINGNCTALMARKVQFGIMGASKISGSDWSVKNSAVINYMSAHDNHTLWDKLALTNPDATDEEKVAINKLGAAIIMISSGTPFMQAGEEMLRTKNGDDNSYKSSDEINNIDWELLTPTSLQYTTMLYYKGLIEIRKSNALFTGNGNIEITFENLTGNAMAVNFSDGEGNVAKVLINPTANALNYTVTKAYTQVADGVNAGLDTAKDVDGSVTVNPVSVAILICKEQL